MKDFYLREHCNAENVKTPPRRQGFGGGSFLPSRGKEPYRLLSVGPFGAGRKEITVAKRRRLLLQLVGVRWSAACFALGHLSLIQSALVRKSYQCLGDLLRREAAAGSQNLCPGGLPAV